MFESQLTPPPPTSSVTRKLVKHSCPSVETLGFHGLFHTALTSHLLCDLGHVT